MWPMVWLPWRRETKRTLAETQKVRCVECGFLAVRDLRTRKIAEAEAVLREGWNIPKGVAGEHRTSLYDTFPMCFRRAARLRQEAERQSGRDTREQTLKVIKSERHCDAYTPWEQGFTPKEHQEMITRAQLQTEQAREKRKDRMWRVFEVALIVVLSGVFTVIGALVSGGWKPFG